jgi:hypothetical protein
LPEGGVVADAGDEGEPRPAGLAGDVGLKKGESFHGGQRPLMMKMNRLSRRSLNKAYIITKAIE